MRGRKCVERIGTPIVVFVAALSISVQAFAPAPSRFPASPTLGSRHDLPLEALREKKGDIKDSPVEDCTIPGDFDAPGRRGELVSLERKEIRLDGFEPYTLVSLLTASAFFEVISDVHVDWDVIFATSHPRDLLGDEWLNAGILLAGGGATITGVYATAIFSLTILYGKTALGLCRDDEHDKFLRATQLQRSRAFQSFSLGILLFYISFALEVCVRTPLAMRLPIILAFAGTVWFGKGEYDIVVAAANPLFAQKGAPEEEEGRAKRAKRE